MTKKNNKKSTGLIALATALTAFSLSISTPALAAKKKTATDPKHPVVTISTSLGDIKVELDAEKAPNTVKNFLTYVKEKHYTNTVFHRVIPNFMIQGGGMTADLAPKSGGHSPIQIESNTGLKNLDGTLAMARTQDPNSATDQFFINVKDNPFLDYQSDQQPGYAVFGKVISGRDIAQKIVGVATTTKGPYENVPVDAVTIKSIRVSSK